MSKDTIVKAIEEVTGNENPAIDIPGNEAFGDYSSNVALQLSSRVKEQESGRVEVKRNPRQIAEKIVDELRKDKQMMEEVEKIEVAGPGFINFWLNKSDLVKTMDEVLEEKNNYGHIGIMKGKKVLLEHTSPNTIKTLHVGHVRNNVLGMSVHNLLEFCGAEVKLDAINNDRGIHVMKAVWAYMKFAKGSEPARDEKSDRFVDKFYVMGAKAAEEDAKAKEEMQELLRKWEAGDSEVRVVWKKLRDWTFEGFKQTYKKLGSMHDYQWFESDFYEQGKEMVEEGLKKGVFRKLDDGAVLSKLEEYSLPDTIVLRADGTSMYHTQDLYLTKLKREKFPSDLYIWDVSSEQDLYLKQLFAMCEQLGIGKRDDYLHLSYGYIYLKGGGKMSSRAGNIISADDLIDNVGLKAREIIDKSNTARGLVPAEVNKVSEMVGIGAIKYSLLKVARTQDIYFDIDESLSLEGNSGPYLQYAVARTQSVLAKSERAEDLPAGRAGWKSISIDALKFNKEEITILRSFIHFSEVIGEAAQNYAPNLLCNYLYDLAQKFNTFYNKHSILEQRTKNLPAQTSKEQSNFRLALTEATGQILKNGLNLLGIQAPERM